MFDNIGVKIKRLAFIIFIIEAVASILYGLVYIIVFKNMFYLLIFLLQFSHFIYNFVWIFDCNVANFIQGFSGALSTVVNNKKQAADYSSLGDEITIDGFESDWYEGIKPEKIEDGMEPRISSGTFKIG